MTFTTSTTPNNMNIIYCRISSATQNLDEQEYACKEYCRQNGLNVNAIVREIGSARYGINNLPKLQDTIFNMGMPFNLIVWSFDRLTRSTSEDLYGIFIDKNINLVTVNDPTPLTFIYWNQCLQQAVTESNLISERVTRSVRYRRAIGDHIGNAGYGYQIQYVPVQKNAKFNRLTQNYDNSNVIGNAIGSGQLISQQINNNQRNVQDKPEINEETHYNRRVLMYNTSEMNVVDFIKNTYQKRLNCREFMNFAKNLIESIDCNFNWTPIKFYKEFQDLDDDNYNPQETKTYFFCYADDLLDIPRKSYLPDYKKIVIQDYHIAAFLNDYHITKRGEYWTNNMVKYIALNHK